MSEFESNREIGEFRKPLEYEILAEVMPHAADAVASYQDLLQSDPDTRRHLGKRSADQLDMALDEISELHDRIKGWEADPSSLTPVHIRVDERRDGSAISLVLREPEGDEVPTDVRSAAFQLEIRAQYAPEKGSQYNEELAAQAYSRAGRHQGVGANTANIVTRALSRTAAEGTLKIGASYAYLDERNERVRIDNGPAVTATLHEGGDVSWRGTTYLGSLPHHTEPYTQPESGRGWFESLREKLQSPDNQKALRSRVREENAKRKF